MEEMNELEVIKETNLLSTDNFDCLNNLREELLHDFCVSIVFRSKWEMENSVLSDVKFPTPDAKYWQAVREQQAHFNELVWLSFEHRKTNQRILMKQAQIRKLEDEKDIYGIADSKIELKKIEIDKLECMKRFQQKTANDRAREIREWNRIKEELKPKLKYSVDNPGDHETESYAIRFYNEAQILDRLGHSQSSAEVLNKVALIDMSQKAMRKNVLPNIENQKEGETT